MQVPFRVLLNKSDWLRRRVRASASRFRTGRVYTPESARRSLETSLRALGTDYVDIFLIHEPRVNDQIDALGLIDYFRRAREQGKIRSWGISGNPDEVHAMLSKFDGSPDILQLFDEISRPIGPPSDAGAGRITFGIIRPNIDRLLAVAAADPGLSARCLQLGGGLDLRDSIGSLLLQTALDRNDSGTVLFSSSRLDRIQLAATAAIPYAEDPELVLSRRVLVQDMVRLLSAIRS